MKHPVLTTCAVAVLMLAASGTVQADFSSTFNVTQADFCLSGFASGGLPTDGPTLLAITNVQGTYDLDIPPAGTEWTVLLESNWNLDFDQNGTVDATIATGQVAMGQFTSPGPSTSWAFSFLAPDMVVDPGPPYGPFQLHDLQLEFDGDVDGLYPAGAFGANAFMNLTISNAAGGNLGDLNYLLWEMDNATGGGDGIIDGWISGDSTVTCVPAPGAALLGVIGFGLVGWVKRRLS